MKKVILFSVMAIAISFASCTRDHVDADKNAPRLAASSTILIEGPDASVIVDNISTVQSNLKLLAAALTDLSQDADFAEVVAAPLRNGTQAGNFAQPLGGLISSDGTNSGIDSDYLDVMEASLDDLGGSSEEIDLLGNIAARFEIADEYVYPKVTVSIIGTRKNTSAEDQNDIDIRPEYIAISQSYQPGNLPAWHITEEGVKEVTVNPEDIYEANVWYIGIADAGSNNLGSGLSFKLLAQGENCSCVIAMTGGDCSEMASNGSSILSCGSTNGNCDCPDGCSGVGQY
jgi:hypothetical protein